MQRPASDVGVWFGSMAGQADRVGAAARSPSCSDGDGQGQRPGLVAQVDEIQAFGVALLAVVPERANQFFGVGVRLFQHRIADE